MRVRIKKIVYPGKSLAEVAGKVVFTDAGLPDEIVEIEPFRERSSFIEARTVAVVEPSPRRVAPRCDHYRACSPWQDMEYALQLEIKGGQVREIFTRELKIDIPGLEVIPSPAVWGYRNRARFHVLREGREARPAYHEPGEESEFVPTGPCHLLPDEANALVGDIFGTIKAFELAGITDVEVRRSSLDGRMLVLFELGPDANVTEICRAFGGLGERFPVAGVVGLAGERGRPREVALLGKDSLEETAAGGRFRFGARSFFQVNGGMLDRAIKEIRGAAAAFGEPRIADLYCGVGTFGILLAPGAKEIFGVESEPDNLRFLRKNLRLNSVGNYAVCEGTSEEWIGEILDREVDIVIVDPPRRGLDPSLVRAVSKRPVPRFYYLSCNPATLARDLKGLLKTYVMESVKVLDFFPHTPHIETLVLLKRI